MQETKSIQTEQLGRVRGLVTFLDYLDRLLQVKLQI